MAKMKGRMIGYNPVPVILIALLMATVTSGFPAEKSEEPILANDAKAMPTRPDISPVFRPENAPQEIVTDCIKNTTCTCKTLYDNSIEVKCCDHGKGKMSRPPTNYPGDMTHLDLAYCGIIELPDGWCKNCSKLFHLHLDYNKIRKINPKTFQGMPLLNYLVLGENKIDFIADGAFAHNPRLGKLEIQYNPKLNIGFLKHVFKGLTNQTRFSMYSDFINNKTYSNHSVLNGSDLAGLEALTVKIISLCHASIREITPSAAQILGSAECLLLQGNRLSLFESKNLFKFIESFRNSTHLQVLDVSGQFQTYKIPRLQRTVRCKVPKADGDNRMKPTRGVNSDMWSSGQIHLPKTLRKINFDHNSGDYVMGPETFAVNSLIIMSMEYCGQVTFQQSLRGLDSLQIISLANTKVKIAEGFSFHSLSNNLKQLILRNCSIKDQVKELTSALSGPMQNLTTLDLSLNEIPSVSSFNFAASTPNLTHLYLNNNSLNDIPLQFPPNIKLVDLSNNQLRILSQNERDFLDRLAWDTFGLFRIDLSGNPFDCCKGDALNFLRWIQTSPVNFLSYTQYVCFKDGQSMIIKETDLHKLRMLCQLPVTIGSSVAAGALFFFVLGAVCSYRKRWWLKYQTRKCCFNCCSDRSLISGEGEERMSLLRSVYIIVSKDSTQDKEFAREEIVPMLRSLNLQPIFHSDDFSTSLPEREGVFRSLRKSKCGIALLSETLLDDELAMYALRLSQGCGSKYLLPILVRSLRAKRLLDPKETAIQNLMKLECAIEWPILTQGQEARDHEGKLSESREEVEKWLEDRV